MKDLDIGAGDGYYIIYTIQGGLNVPLYLTPDRAWALHRYQAEVFRTTNDFEDALQWVRKQGKSPSCTPADEQPADPRYHGSQQPTAWRKWQ